MREVTGVFEQQLRVQLFADGIASSRVEWRILNPTHETPSNTVRGLGGRVPLRVPGDEGINGDWVLEVRDTGIGAPGYFRGVRLSFTSRWD
ncbi:MAG: hypothetical protein Q8S42_03400 [Archangium sp.]|nr:hypothetical protein [Archangium sp.]